MIPDDLQYTKLQKILAVYEEKGRGESIAFLNWFLEKLSVSPVQQAHLRQILGWEVALRLRW